MSKRITFQVSGNLQADLDLTLKLIKEVYGVTMTQADLLRISVSQVIRILLPILHAPPEKRVYTQADVEELLRDAMKIENAAAEDA